MRIEQPFPIAIRASGLAVIEPFGRQLRDHLRISHTDEAPWRI